MKLRRLVFSVGTVCAWSAPALAGGLFVPGSGAVSTSRAGASVAATDDGESIAINPAGMAKSHGTIITISAAMVDYDMTFARSGTYDTIAEEPTSYAGQPYAPVHNEGKPAIGIGPFQAVPIISVVSDLGGMIPGLHVGFDVHAPNASPTRSMGENYQFPDGPLSGAPPATRYDVVHQEAAVVFPTIAVAYRVLPKLDFGASVSSGTADLKTSVFLWGNPFNYEEWVKGDALFVIHAKSSFVPQASLGTTFRPTPEIELGASYTSVAEIHAKGDAQSFNGPQVTIQSGGNPLAVQVIPVADANARCAAGGTPANLKGCVDLALPQHATLGGRYKFLDRDGVEQGDVELDATWENWSNDLATNYNVVVDGQVVINNQIDNGLDLKTSKVRHGLQDTYGVRLGGSYRVPVGHDLLIVRGGVAYDTAAAKTGWERVDFDGAARTTMTAGASYRMNRVQVTAGAGFVYEGSRTNAGTCNPTSNAPGCSGTGQDTPQPQRTGPDPINPLLTPDVQAQSPYNQGTMTSKYVLLMLGVSTWF